MFIASIVLFAIAALGGATLAVMRLMNRPLPVGLAVVHGLFAAAGLVVLIIAMVSAVATGTLLKAALILFIIAAIGGAIIFLFFHLRGKHLPIPLVLGHGLLAVVAFLLLLINVFSG
jgi:hypothetical protein